MAMVMVSRHPSLTRYEAKKWSYLAWDRVGLGFTCQMSGYLTFML